MQTPSDTKADFLCLLAFCQFDPWGEKCFLFVQEIRLTSFYFFHCIHVLVNTVDQTFIHVSM